MKHALRCMKNEAGFAHEACLRHTEKFKGVLRFTEAARLLLHSNAVAASYLPKANASFFLPSYLLFYKYVI